MTKYEAVTMLLDRLGLSAAAAGEARASECRSILTEALAAEELPTSWFEVWDRVAALEERTRGRPAGAAYDFRLIYGPLNVAVNTTGVTFPREFW